MTVRTKHLIFVRENALEIQSCRFPENLFQQRGRNLKTDKVVLTIWCVTSSRYFQNVESKFRGDLVTYEESPLAHVKTDAARDRTIHADLVTVVVPGRSEERPKGKSVAVKSFASRSRARTKSPLRT
jgi:hypothetical protein